MELKGREVSLKIRSAKLKNISQKHKKISNYPSFFSLEIPEI
jgi:hypothetical protein